jgi:TRAP-type C4-dicarboxylate transport system substrate-binding protein
MHRAKTARWAIAAAVAATVMVSTACQGPDRAGGAADLKPTVLAFAQPNGGQPPDQLAAWAKHVGELTGGSLEIEFKNGWRMGEADYESATIADVKAGKVDMAWVGARAFDRTDVTSFQALLAPMLIDSHDLQAQVFEQGIPQEMLAGLDRLDLVGVGILPGPMRKVLGVKKPFTKPTDFSGAVVGMQDSQLTELTFTTLGATTKPLPSGAKLDGVDAYEQQLSSIWGNHYELSAGFVTSNLNLWPRPLVLFIDKAAYDELNDDQRQALTSATNEAMLQALDASRAEDNESVADLCKAGLEFVDVPAANLGSLERAWAPVYDKLRANADTNEWIERITALKASLNASPDAARCDQGASQQAGASQALDGTYEMTVSWPAMAAKCPPGGAEGTSDEVVYELRLAGGVVEQFARIGGRDAEPVLGYKGTYRVFRDQIEFIDSSMTATFTFDGKTLTLSDLRGGECGDATIWTTKPWVRVTGGSGGSQLEGTWTTTLSEADWAGVSDRGPADKFTLTFQDGFVTVTDPGGEVGYRAKYRTFRDRIETSGHDDVLTASFVLDGDKLTFSDIEVPGCNNCPYVVVWGSHPWVRQ